jgi:hypothetical protein
MDVRSKNFKIMAIIGGAFICCVSVAATIFIISRFSTHTERTTGKSIVPKDIIEAFEISALDYGYSGIIFERNTSERKFLFVSLDDATQMYAVQFEGEIKMGINGKDIKIDEQYDGESKVLKISIPKAYIISHAAPLNDSAEVIYDISEHMEHAQIGQYIDLFNDKKKEIEYNLQSQGMLERAQQSAKKQLETLLNSVPDVSDNYKLEFILE